MYRDKLLYGLMATAALFAGCSDDFSDISNAPKNPVAEGDEILFGATNLNTFDEGFTDGTNKNGRTAYGDAWFESTDPGDPTKGKWHYPLKWVYGDSISVYSPQASFPNSDFKYADYEIAWAGGTDGAVADTNTIAYLVRTGENGLHWGDVHEEHTFYAFYPSKVIKDDDSFNNGVVDGYIPKYQQMVKWEKKTEQDENGTSYTHWVGTPDMHLAFMRAEKRVKPDTIAEGSPLALDFKPLTTAVEVTLEAKEDMASAEVQMIHVRGLNKNKTQKQCIAGNFTYDIDQGKTTYYLNQDIANDYEISVPLWASVDGGNPAPISLKANDKVTFTVFLLPAEHPTAEGSTGVSRDLTNLQLEVIGFNGNSQIKTYENVKIPQGTKSQVILPKYKPAEGSTNNWMSRIPENTYIYQLTIPGATDALSGEIITSHDYPGDDKPSDFTQHKNLETLFNEGVRAFEIGTDRDVNLIACGNNATKDGITFDGVIDRLNSCLQKSQSEFVVVTVYYLHAWEAGDGLWKEPYEDWAKALNGKISGLTEKNVIPYSNGLTVEKARGKILLFIRTNDQEGKGKFSGYPTIAGWNNMKDKWLQRGYNAKEAPDYFKDWNSDRRNQWTGYGNPKEAGYHVPTLDDWAYVDANNENQKYYVQEWKRVCAEKGNYLYADHALLPDEYQYWFDSKQEKIDCIKDFFKDTKSNLKDVKGVTSLFINHMGGFYLVSGYSAAPNYDADPSYGRTGNIIKYSSEINTEIYKHVLSVSYENRGPLGIVYFNFAGVESLAMPMHGDYLLSALIGNNFSIPLMGTSDN